MPYANKVNEVVSFIMRGLAGNPGNPAGPHCLSCVIL